MFKNIEQRRDNWLGSPGDTTHRLAGAGPTFAAPVQRMADGLAASSPSASFAETRPPLHGTARDEAVLGAFGHYAEDCVSAASEHTGAGRPQAPESRTQAVAAQGVQGRGEGLPHLDRIQASFGHHDVGGVDAHVGGNAATAAETIGAEAYATGDSVAFREAPNLHTAAHEAAHVVQQRAGVHLKGGVGQEGDHYEQHADRVADMVVQGESAESLLDTEAGVARPAGAGSPGSRGGAVQRKGITLSRSCSAPDTGPTFEQDRERWERNARNPGLWPGGSNEPKSHYLHRREVENAKRGPQQSQGLGTLTQGLSYPVLRMLGYSHKDAVIISRTIGAGSNLVAGGAKRGNGAKPGPPRAPGYSHVGPPPTSNPSPRPGN